MSVSRVVPEDNRAVIKQSDFEEDFKRGYCITVWQPATVKVVRDHRTGRELKNPVDAVLNYCCMRCAFSTPTPLHITEHWQKGSHRWSFNPFSNPYGHIADVVIEGIDDNDENGRNYNTFLKEKYDQERKEILT